MKVKKISLQFSWGKTAFVRDNIMVYRLRGVSHEFSPQKKVVFWRKEDRESFTLLPWRWKKIKFSFHLTFSLLISFLPSYGVTNLYVFLAFHSPVKTQTSLLEFLSELERVREHMCTIVSRVLLVCEGCLSSSNMSRRTIPRLTWKTSVLQPKRSLNAFRSPRVKRSMDLSLFHQTESLILEHYAKRY